jgi:hypothetical protein
MYDWEHSFNLEWDSKEAFKIWLDNEQTDQSIELRPFQIKHGSALYTTNHTFCCMCNGTGGHKHYQKKTGWEWKIENKWLAGGCPCLVQIKMYSGSKNCPNVWLLWKDEPRTNQIKYIKL